MTLRTRPLEALYDGALRARRAFFESCHPQLLLPSLNIRKLMLEVRLRQDHLRAMTTSLSMTTSLKMT